VAALSEGGTARALITIGFSILVISYTGMLSYHNISMDTIRSTHEWSAVQSSAWNFGVQYSAFQFCTESDAHP
jgi:hypothetical protein